MHLQLIQTGLSCSFGNFSLFVPQIIFGHWATLNYVLNFRIVTHADYVGRHG